MKTTALLALSLTLLASCSKNKETRTEATNSKETIMREVSPSVIKETAITRVDTFSDILDEKNDLPTKLFAAENYFKSFEYQLRTGTAAQRDRVLMLDLYLEAAREFSAKTLDLYQDVNFKKLSPLKEGKKQNEEQAFFAIAAKMDTTINQAPSMFELTRRSLFKDLNKEPLEAHEVLLMTGENKELMIDLLKARIDILAMLALKNLTTKKEMSVTQKARGLIFKITGGHLGAIDLPETYEQSNEVTKEAIVADLEKAVRTKNILRELGLSQTLDKTLRSALIQIDFNENKRRKKSEEEKAADAVKENIRRLINDLLG
jgi:hypothetical protein